MAATADETASLVLRIEGQTTRVEKQLRRLEGEVRNSTRRIEQSFDKAFQNINRSVSFQGISATLAGLGLGVGAKEIIDFADAFTLMQNKLVASGTDIENVNVKMDELADVAIRSRSELGATVALYSKLSLAAKELALSQGEVARITETVNKALQTGGASASEAQSATLQLAQGIASGTLQGDELRAIRENSRVLAQAIADEFGVTVGQLKALGEEGRITSDRVAKALLGASSAVDAAFAGTAVTIQQAFTNLYTELQRFIGNQEDFTTGTRRLVEALEFLSANMNVVAPAAAAATAALAAFLAASVGIGAIRAVLAVILSVAAAFKAYSTGAVTATGATLALGRAMLLLGPITAAISVAVLVFGALTTEAEASNTALTRLAEGAKDLNQLKPLIDQLTKAQEAYTAAVARHGVEQSDVSRAAMSQSKARLQLLQDELDLELKRATAAKTLREQELRSLQDRRVQLKDTVKILAEEYDLSRDLGQFVSLDERTNKLVVDTNKARQAGGDILERAVYLVEAVNEATQEERVLLQENADLIAAASIEFRKQAIIVDDLAAAIEDASTPPAIDASAEAQTLRNIAAAQRYGQVVENLGSKTKKAFDDVDIDLTRPTVAARQNLEDLVSFARNAGTRAGTGLSEALRLAIETRRGAINAGDFRQPAPDQASMQNFKLPPETLYQLNELTAKLDAGDIKAAELRDAFTKLAQVDPKFAIYAEELTGFLDTMANTEDVTAAGAEALALMTDVAEYGADAVANYTDRLADGADAFTDAKEAAGEFDQVRLQGLQAELEYAEDQLQRITDTALPGILDGLNELEGKQLITPEQLARLEDLVVGVENGEVGVDQLATALNDLDVQGFEGQAILAGIRNIATEAFNALGAVLGLKAETTAAGGGDPASYARERERQLSLTEDQARLEAAIAREKADARREGVQLSQAEAEAFAKAALAQQDAFKDDGGGGGGGGENDPLADLAQKTAELQALRGQYEELNPIAADYSKQVRVAKEEQELLNQLQAGGIPITDAMRNNVRQVAEAYVDAELALEATQEAQENLRQRSEEWRDTLKEASSSFVKDLLAGKSAADALAGALQNIASKLVDIALEQAFAGLFGDGFGVKKGGGLLSGLLGLANGGPANRNTPYIVGERGPELFVPGKSGRIIPNGVMAGQSSGATVNIANYSGAEVQQTKRQEGGRDIIDVVIGEVQNRMSQGKFDRTLQGRFGMQPKLIGR